jgi:molecular chaperone DnaK (HSP70)/Tfp pilus assembly protein PilZ
MPQSDDSGPLHKPGREGRLHRRFPVDWRVTLRVPASGLSVRVAAHNASRGGLFVLTARPPEVGALVELTIELPDGARLDVTGTVQHVVTPERALAANGSPGIGVKIDERHATDILLLEQMSEAATASQVTFATRAVPRSPVRAPVGRIGLVSGAAARAVAVDLGTGYTRLGCSVGDRVQLALDAEGRGAQPSVVAYGDGDPPLAGWAARERLAVDPHRAVAGAKQLLGRQLGEARARQVLGAATFRALEVDGALAVDLEARKVPVVEVCAALLAHVRETAERQLRWVRDAVFTVDAGAPEAARAALRDAATRAGFHVVGLIEEPVAAAVAAGAGAEGEERTVVYDLGAGGVAVSVLDIAGDRARVLAHEVDPHVSCAELDEALADAVADAFWRSTRIELRQAVIPWQRLLLACETVKQALLADPVAEIALDGIADAPAPVDLRHKLTRADLAALGAPMIDRSLELCARVLERAGVRARDVRRVIPAGGGARLPFVRPPLERFFERSLELAPAPEELVVTGAARRAASAIRIVS